MWRTKVPSFGSIDVTVPWCDDPSRSCQSNNYHVITPQQSPSHSLTRTIVTRYKNKLQLEDTHKQYPYEEGNVKPKHSLGKRAQSFHFRSAQKGVQCWIYYVWPSELHNPARTPSLATKDHKLFMYNQREILNRNSEIAIIVLIPIHKQFNTLA